MLRRKKAHQKQDSQLNTVSTVCYGETTSLSSLAIVLDLLLVSYPSLVLALLAC